MIQIGRQGANLKSCLKETNNVFCLLYHCVVKNTNPRPLFVYSVFFKQTFEFLPQINGTGIRTNGPQKVSLIP